MIHDLPVNIVLGGETNAQGDMSSPAGNDANTQDESNTPPQPVAAAKQKCNAKGCPFFAPIVLLESCSREACDKFVHPIWYKKWIRQRELN